MSHNPLDNYFSDDLRMTPGQLDQIRDLESRIETSGCTSCKLHQYRKGDSPVPGDGNGRIMLVGHRIGHNEYNDGTPAIGQASLTGFEALLESIIGDISHVSPTEAREFMLDYCYVTNAARCGHDRENVGAAAWKRCAPKWLEQECRIVDPEIVVFWKKGVADTLLEKSPGKGEVSTMYLFGKEQLVARNRHPVSLAHQGTAQHTLSIRRAIQSDFHQVLKELHSQGLMNQPPEMDVGDSRTEHVLVDTPEGLGAMKEDLKEKRWIGLDSETFFTAGPGEMTGYEEENGALLWHDERQEMTCYQICASDFASRQVDRTYTVAMRFRDQLIGTPRQEISPEEAIGALDDLFSMDTEREVCFHNAMFDAPVFTKEGLDLWGIGQRDYNIRIWDTLVLAGRLNEHLGVKEGMSSLDNLAKMLLGETKGSFTDRFDPFTFAYEDITDAQTRQEVLEYTGEDPRKTILVLFELFDEIESHRQEVFSDINTDRSPLPQIGFNPYPIPNTQETGFRLRDVALRVDHQMVPQIGEMEMVGFDIDTEEIEERYRFIQGQKQTLKRLVQDDYEWYNPNSDQDAQEVISRIFREIGSLLTKIYHEVPGSKVDSVLEAFQINHRWFDEKIDEAVVRRAYEDRYGEADGQKDTILDKVLVFLQAGMRLLEEELAITNVSLPEELPKELDHEHMELFFERVFMFKQLHKRASTYFDRFASIADPEDLIHPEYGISTTRSGRFSGNFQNVPRGGAEDRELIKQFLEITNQLPEDEKEKERLISEHNKIDFRQTCFIPQPEKLNHMFDVMNLQSPDGTPWRVREDDTYVAITADYASQEDRMAYALSGDETKAFLLSEGWDTHFTNVAFCFGQEYGYSVQSRDGSVDWDEMKEAYDHFTSNKAKFKPMLRTPMKNVHYASTYGAEDEKIHTLIAPIFQRQGKEWSLEDTMDLKARYDQFYAGVTRHRNEVLESLDESPYLSYPIYGAIRHALVEADTAKGSGAHDVVGTEYLSSANALNQGTSAYVTKTGMIRTRHLIEANASRWNLVHDGGDTYVGINLQVHDELGVICPARLAREVIEVLESGMKFAIEPGDGELYWNEKYTDAMGQDGWMCMTDPTLRGGTLFDADAEVKISNAKAKTLSDGTKNILAHSHDPDSIDELEEKHPPEGIDESDPLTIANKHRIDDQSYLF